MYGLVVVVASEGSGASVCGGGGGASGCTSRKSQINSIHYPSLKGSAGRRVWLSDHANSVSLNPGLGSIIMKPRTPSIATFS